MRLLTLIAAALLPLASAVPGDAQTRPPQRPPDLVTEGPGVGPVMSAVRREDWAAARALAAARGGVARDLADWHRFRAGRGGFEEVARFLGDNDDWPDLGILRTRMEKVLPLGGQAEAVVDFFDGAAPRTGHGTVALINAYRALGREGDAEAEAARAWLTRSMTAGAEATLLGAFPEVLRPLDAARLDAMIWDGETRAAGRALARADADHAALGRARLALRADAGALDRLIAAVPEALKGDAGLAYERFRWRLGKGRREDALELLAERSVSAAALGRPEAWGRARRDLARRLMRAGETDRAYAVASTHWLAPGRDYADLEWLSGYIALTYRDDPGRALTHFRRFRDAVFTPISLGRAGYWQGRVQEALGRPEAAEAAYRFGAAYQTSFYGLLAAEKAGLPLDPALAGTERFAPLDGADFARGGPMRAARALLAAGERDLAERFLRHVATGLERDDLGSLAAWVLEAGDPHIAVMLGKEAAKKGWVIARPYYPVVDLGVDDMPVAPELALAIARRESEFDAIVSSGVGASGLMQLMPGTARDVAQELGLPYSRTRLFTDPVYNATLGTHYLAGLIRRFGDNPVLVSAGYNAGPGRPIRWMRERGDPRFSGPGGADIVDWIEHIPFDETRNYAMRVAESLPVYRARLAGEAGEPMPRGALRFTEELTGR